MKKLLAVLASLALVPLGVAPAQAATLTVVVHGFDYPAGLDSAWQRCGATPYDGTAQRLYRAGGTRGTHATGLRFGGSTIGERGVSAIVPTPSAVTGISFDTMHPLGPTGASPGHFFAEIDPSGGNFQTFYYADVELTINRSTFGQFNLGGVALDWYFWDGVSFSAPVANDKTVAQFASTVGSGSVAKVGFMFGCDGRDYYMDDLQIVAGGTTTIYDFEGVPTETYLSTYDGHHSGHFVQDLPKLTLLASQYHWLAGDSWSLGDGFVGEGWFDGKARLYAKPYGKPRFGLVTSQDFTTDAHAWFKVRPFKNTVYRVDTPGTSIFEPSTSRTLTVKVKRRVKVTVADSKIFRGGRIQAFGRLKPRTSGIRVSLQHKTSSGWRTIASEKTGRNGTYSLAARATSAGKWVIRVVAAGGKGNLGNRSRTATVTVRVPPPKPPAHETKTPIVIPQPEVIVHEPDDPKVGRIVLRHLYQQFWRLGETGAMAVPVVPSGTSSGSVVQVSPQ